jgi:Lon protease-like protein
MENKVYLFPLQNSILFKKVTLPYHIFEPRYRQMIKDSIDFQIPIAVVPHNDFDDYRGEVCVAGLPHILSTYPDGRLDIYITGAVKCRLTDFESEKPYKIYRYRPVEESLDSEERFDMELTSLKIMLERWANHFLPDIVQRESFAATLEDPELLINYCAVFLVDDPSMKRMVMIAGTLEEKVRILLHVIGPKEISLGPFMPTLKF